MLQARATAAGGEVTAAMLSGLGADFQPGVGAVADFSFNLNCGAPEPLPPHSMVNRRASESYT